MLNLATAPRLLLLLCSCYSFLNLIHASTPFNRHWRTIAPHHPAIVAEAVDVPLEAAPYGDRVIHGVWCKKAADGDNNNTIEKNLAPSSMTPSTTTMPRPTLYEAAKEATPIICLHGFGAGAGLYYASLPGIAAAVNGPVYAIDWLGAGFSSRQVKTLTYPPAFIQP